VKGFDKKFKIKVAFRTRVKRCSLKNINANLIGGQKTLRVSQLVPVMA